MRKSTIYLYVLGLVVMITAAVVSTGMVVSAQNANSSTTMTNSNKRSTTRRTNRKPANTNTSDQANANMSSSANANTGAGRRHASRKSAGSSMAKTSGRCDPTKQEQTDLSGTYMGKADHGNGQPPQDATLTITGNNFTMTSGSETHSGRITAVTTCGYIAVTMMMGDLTPPAPSPNPPAAMPAVSLRAKKVGDKLWLMSVPGESMKVSFTPTGGGRGAMKKPRKHRMTTKKTDTGAPAKTTP